MSGKDFVKELHETRGLLEAYRIGKEYLKISREHNTDPDEVQFCAEIETELRKLDMI